MSISRYTDRLKLRQNSISDTSSVSSERTFYEELDENIKRDIHTLIDSGYNKNVIVKLYLILNPISIEEAIEYLSKKNGLYQHIFYSNSKKINKCVICGYNRNQHIKEYEKTINTKGNNSQTDLSFIREIKFDEKISIKERNKCEICLELFENSKLYECEICKFHFCGECLYDHIETLIKEQKEIICPNSKCQYIYKENFIMNLLSKNCKDNQKFNQLKNTYEKIKIKFLVLSNPDKFIFCPITDCDGYGKKSSDSFRCICNHGHTFCYRCGEFWHEDGNCPEDRAVDELFEDFVNKLNMKRCPSCRFYIIKKDGCNHITCTYCKKEWCYICGELLNSCLVRISL